RALDSSAPRGSAQPRLGISTCAALLHGSRWMHCAMRKSKSPSRRRIARRSVMRPLAAWLPLAASIAAMASEVSIEEWDVPTENSRPHDPAVAPDGALWFTEQRANKLGRLDPRTGQMKEFPLRTPGSGPHGLVADREGSIWFTAISKGYVGKLDPKTGSVKEYPTPDPRARDPHTPVFDQRGRLWFTLEQSNFIGRLDPPSGEMRLA